MKLRALLKDQQHGDEELPDVELLGLCEHTQEVQNGFGFCAVSNTPEIVSEHCRIAGRRGAAALLLDAALLDAQLRRDLDNAPSIPRVGITDLAAQRGKLAARFYGEPSKAMTCIGVTGTNGKTSTAFHIADLLERCGTTAGYMGTLGWGHIARLQDVGMTTPNPVAIQRQLAQLRDRGATCTALEVSSHALAQGRATQVAFDCAVFTNLSRDHLDYHGSMSAYQAAKQKLFTDWPLQRAVINCDDPFGQQLMQVCAAEVISYGAGGDWQWRSTQQGHQTRVSWTTPHGEFEHTFAGIADYAVANLTAAMAAVVAVGQPLARVVQQLGQVSGVPGRMEVVRTDQPATPLVLVDYAHTPDALQKVLGAVPRTTAGKLICVVGCGGDRDTGKRPQMGEIAQRLADEVWLTADNPRSEEPLVIIKQMQDGMTVPRTGVHVCADRRQAIAGAIDSAGSEDTVLIAGKGHETYQEIAGQRLDFDDRQVARSVLEGKH